jgi:sortase B
MASAKTNFKNQKERIWNKAILHRRVKLWVALVVFLCVFACSSVYIGAYYYDVFSQRGIESRIVDMAEAAKQDFNIDTPNPSATPKPIDDEKPEDEGPTESAWARERRLLMELEAQGKEVYAEILEINPDFLGMIEIPGLIEAQPYVHSHDNEDYLGIDFYGNRNRMGTVFLNAFNCRLMMDYNSAFYGHHSGSGNMFTNIKEYKNAETFKTSPIITLDGLLGKSVWIVFSAQVTEPTMWYTYPVYQQSEFADLIEEMKARSLFVTDVEVTTDDRVITLSVCDYTYENMRFVVHARRLRPGEEIPGEVLAEPNENRKEFQVPDLQSLGSLNMSGTAVTRDPAGNRFFFYKTQAGVIQRFYGDSQSVQGPSRALAHSGISAGSNTAALIRDTHEDGGAGRGVYVAVQGVDGQSGIYLFTGDTPTSTLNFDGQITPAGVDARYPAIQSSDGVRLLYSVHEGRGSRLYRQTIDGGDREHLYTVHGVADVQPLGYYVINGAPLVIWYETESGWIGGGWVGGNEFIIDRIEGNARVMLYGGLNNGVVRAVVEGGGRMIFTSISLESIPPPM